MLKLYRYNFEFSGPYNGDIKTEIFNSSGLWTADNDFPFAQKYIRRFSMATVGENFYLSGGNWDGYYSKSVAKVQRDRSLTPTLS